MVIAVEGMVLADTRGRVTLGRDVAQKYGRRFAVVQVPREIILIPIPKDPMASLAVQGKRIPSGMSLGRARQLATDRAIREGNAKKRR